MHATHDDVLDYEHAPLRVRDLYYKNHTIQTMELVKEKRAKYHSLELGKYGIWEMLEKLNTLVDESDPDTSLSQIQHALQCAEAARRDEKPDWFILTTLIHDLGKILFFEGESQHLVVGDTFPLGLPFSDKIVYAKYFSENPDSKNSEYQQSPFGIYSPGIGLDSVIMSFGHDDYLAKVCERYLPKEALACIKYHSFYSWHRDGAYRDLMNADDEMKLKAVQEFNPYDLYTKHDVEVDVEQVKPYYLDLIAKFFPGKIDW
ncbi:inositol oxygenase [Synchytrium endobioticum]|uniref:Inositol oxygenase n=1 Tax=Synchytrium endobioticum TaxID=286115 RepID=A0A507CWY2_9FUNG|nr:inositol oxygenase [Synchytrium endobioticum]